MPGALSRRLALSALVGLGLLALASQALAASPAITAAMLKPAQVGPGYRLLERTDGNGIKTVTLDLCGSTFPSEKLRTDRRQVSYAHTGIAIGYSQEVVTYKPGKAAQAMAELRRAAKSCPTKAVASPGRGGPPIKYEVTTLTHGGLRPGYVAIHIHASAIVQGQLQQQTVVAVYQVKGDLLSGVYAYPAQGTSKAQLAAAAFHAAEAAAQNLAG